MKKIFTTALWLLALHSSAQIVNPGFESWTGTQPQGWDNSNGDGSNTSVISTNDAHSGSRAVQLSVVQVFGFNLPGAINQMETPISNLPTTLRFWMESSFPNESLLLVSATIYDNESNALASAISFESNEYSNYTEIVVPFEVVDQGVPSKVDIIFSIGSLTGQPADVVGAVVRIDDVSLSSTPVNVEEEVKKAAELTVFPNPASGDAVTLQTDFTGAVDIQIADMTGKMVFEKNMQNVDSNGIIRLDVSTLASGMYTISVRGDGAIASTRLKKE